MKEEKEKSAEESTPERIIEKHIATLARKFDQLTAKKDDYGLTDYSAWESEKKYFIEKVLLTQLDREKVDVSELNQIIEEKVRSFKETTSPSALPPVLSTLKRSTVKKSPPIACSKLTKKDLWIAGTAVVSSLVIFVLLGVWGFNMDLNSARRAAAKKGREIDATVRYAGGSFIVSNNNGYDWHDVKLKVNFPLGGDGYYLNLSQIAAHDTISVSASRFANGQGERFNPWTQKPRKFAVRCNTPNGREGYYANWE